MTGTPDKPETEPETRPETRPETKRGRVRRLLLDPLIADGMRCPSWFVVKRDGDGEIVKTVDQLYRAYLDRLADALAYMSDEGLKRLREALYFNAEPAPPPQRRTAGRRYSDEWPSFVAVFDLANGFEPCPLSLWPGLRGWFATQAGPRALASDIAVETYDFILANKRPPIHDRERAAIANAAWARRRHLAGLETGLVLPADAMKRDRYLYRLEKVTALIAGFRAGAPDTRDTPDTTADNPEPEFRHTHRDTAA